MQTLEMVMAKFERAMASGELPDIASFLAQHKHQINESESSHDLFEELVHTDLELRIRNGMDARVEDYLDRYPKIQTNQQLVLDLVCTEFRVRQQLQPGLHLGEFTERFPEFVDTLATKQLGGDSTIGSSVTIENLEPQPNVFSNSDFASRFRKQRIHAKGGLANIWQATDLELKRPVAIKEIKAKFAHSKVHRSRFAKETVVTSQLEHPGIVPVYGLGHRMDGTPYFAMQLVNGITLKQAIFESRSLDEPFADTTEDHGQIEFRRLLQRLLAVCDTVQYAHRQGVIHRDLKPDNIMLGQFGETYVLDWGLAKTLDSDFEISVGQNGYWDDSLAKFVEESQGHDTIMGSRIGSPGYMSPEQERGELDQVGVASDVYSLGATVWTLVSGEAPPNNNALEPQEHQLQWLTNRKPGKQLEPLKSICAKAMSPNPNDRYASVSEFALDIENYLVDRKVSVHAESWGDGFARFTRKNRTFLYTTMAALVVIAALSIAAAAWINVERQKTVEAKLAEVAQRQVAEEALALEKAAKTKAGAAQHKAEQRTEQLTRTLDLFARAFSGIDKRGVAIDLNDVTLKDLLDHLPAELGSNEDTMVQAFLHNVKARRFGYDGKLLEAREHYESSLRLLDEEAIEPSDLTYIGTLIGLGYVQFRSGDLDAATETADRIVTIGRQSNCPPDKLSRALALQARIESKKRNPAKAWEIIEEAYELAKEAYAEQPGSPELMSIFYYRGALAFATKHTRETFESNRKIIDFYESNGRIHQLLIQARLSQATQLLFYSKKRDEAMQHIEKAYGDAVELRGENHPETLSVKTQLASTGAIVFAKSPDKRERYLTMLEELRSFYMKQGSKQESVTATLVLTGTLRRIQESDDRAVRIIELITEVLEKKDYTSAKVFPSDMFQIHRSLTIALKKLGHSKSAAESMRATLPFAIKVYGEDSPVTEGLQTQIRLFEEGKTIPKLSEAEIRKALGLD